MKMLFYFGHPSQYLFLRNSINILKEHGSTCDLVIKSKDVLERLLIENNESYINILPEGRRPGRMGILTGLIKRDLRLFMQIRKKHYDLLIGTDPSLAHIGFLKRIPVITVLEDDIDVIPQLASITFPFTSLILTPKGCKTGRYEKKTIHYNGYMKLAYLHPRWFKKEAAKFKQPYFLIRASGLAAYHDEGISGFNVPLLEKIVSLLQEKGSVYISSEVPLTGSLKQYELNINPSEMQQVLANSYMLISDSQSMTVEAAMLGIPSVRFSDFAGRITVLEELEHVFSLTFGIPAGNPEKLFERINELMSLPDLENVFAKRRARMIAVKIDVTAFLVWFIENYPKSVSIMKENPDYQDRFR
jgi:predicted glycosyltransferase